MSGRDSVHKPIDGGINFGWTDQLTSHSVDSAATTQPITDQYMSHRSMSASFAGR